MTEAELVSLLRRFVPDISERTGGDGGETPVAKLIFQAYRHGPAGVADAAGKERLGASLRQLLAALREGDKQGSLPAGLRRGLCQRLVEAFQAGPAAQIRIIEVLAEGIAAGPDATSRGVMALALLGRERALDKTVLRLHPEAAQDPQQLAQLVNLYRQRLRFTDLPPAEAAQGSGAPAPRSSEEAMAALAEALDLPSLAMELVADVNRLPGESEERQVDLEGLRQWAQEVGDERAVLYDAAQAALYSGRPADEKRPFLHPLAAVKVLHGMLVRGATPASNQA